MSHFPKQRRCATTKSASPILSVFLSIPDPARRRQDPLGIGIQQEMECQAGIHPLSYIVIHQQRCGQTIGGEPRPCLRIPKKPAKIDVDLLVCAVLRLRFPIPGLHAWSMAPQYRGLELAITLRRALAHNVRFADVAWPAPSTEKRQCASIDNPILCRPGNVPSALPLCARPSEPLASAAVKPIVMRWRPPSSAAGSDLSPIRANKPKPTQRCE